MHNTSAGFSGRHILITGGCGFVGSSLAIALKTKYPNYQITAFDNLKRRGSELNITRLASHGIRFVHGDLRVKEDLDQVGPVDTIIDAAAEPSVLAGLDGGTDYLLQTNFMGTVHCLDFARKHKADFIFLSTSRVYSINDLCNISLSEGESRFEIDEVQPVPGMRPEGISHEFPIHGARSLYGATKLASELMIREYVDMFGLKAVINRCGVISGAWQMGKVDQGVVVLWMARHFWKGNLAYIGFNGTGKQVRDILHADDLFRLVDFEIHNIDKVNGEVFNAGGGLQSSASLMELTQYCADITGNKIQVNPVVENRTADIPLYITDNSRAFELTGWQPEKNVRDVLVDIHSWIRENENRLKPILN